MTQPVEISVIVVNYGTADLAVMAVESVLSRAQGGRGVDVHLVDNASPGADAELLRVAHAEREWGDRVQLYCETVNHGFGRGNNVVLRHLAARPTPPKYVFLLNPDARLENEAPQLLAADLDRHPEAGFAGAAITKPGGTPVTACFRFPSILSEGVSALGFGPVSRLFSGWTVPLPHDHPAGEVDWVSGAAVMARFSVMQALDFFDPAYFLYYEEVDLMRRGARRGFGARYVPEARVVHVEGAATDVKSGRAVPKAKPAYWYESWRTYFLHQHGRSGALMAGLATLLGAGGNRVLSALRRRPSSVPPRFFRDFWQHGVRPLLTQ